MRYAFFTEDEQSSYDIALLVPTIRSQEICDTYFTDSPVHAKETIVLELHTAPGKKKTPVSQIKEFIDEELVDTLNGLKVRYVLCAQADYFKVLTGAKKVDVNLGYVLPSSYGDWKVIYIPNYRTVFYDPDTIKPQIQRALMALVEHRLGCYTDPGTDILKTAYYPQTYDQIKAALEELLELDIDLANDIETFGLKHHDAGIGTIAFAVNQHEGLAFAVDYEPIPGATEAPFGRQVRNEPVRALLKDFFQRLMAKQIWHSISFDVYVLIYQLFMEDLLDTEGLLEGLEVMLRNWDCTKLITYLATNSCAGNDLSLKTQSQEFSGNYAMSEINDITRIPLPDLLRYNLIDACSTHYVRNKHWPTVIADEQLEIYETLFKSATLDIIQMQLTGLPLNMQRVKEVKTILERFEKTALDRMEQSNVTAELVSRMDHRHVAKRNSELKKKQIQLGDEPQEFNPNSNPQLQELLYDVMGLPIIALTDSKMPSADGDTLVALKNHTSDPEIIDFLDALIDYKAVNKILTSFIPAFERAPQAPDGWHYLYGNFNLGGTVSGRLSSSGPNLQNLPANVYMAFSDVMLALFPELAPFVKKGMLSIGKLIKSCFEAPPGWLFVGLDFDSLEDKISALTTKDPNKLKVYTDGYDGHCLRAYSYFGMKMDDIDPNSVESINSIADKYPDERQASKVPTFLLTYGGTYMGITQQTGLDKQKACEIEASYHELYKVSDDWVDKHVQKATETGYVTAAFGLRVRTPLLKQVIRRTSKTPYEAEAEGRTAGNAMGQSWCLLNSRASADFMKQVRSSKFRLDIKPSAHIHDAQYLLVRDDIEPLHYTNTHLVKAVEWQEHPDIAHPEVKLSGAVDIFHPTWATSIGIPPRANPEVIIETIAEHMKLAA